MHPHHDRERHPHIPSSQHPHHHPITGPGRPEDELSVEDFEALLLMKALRAPGERERGCRVVVRVDSPRKPQNAGGAPWAGELDTLL